MEKSQVTANIYHEICPGEMSTKDAKSFNPVTLAFMGDAIYETYIRHYVVMRHPKMKTGELHRICIRYVKATAQSMALSQLRHEFTEDEQMVFKRGRNASSASPPKNTPIVEYKRATGLEAVFGFLFFTGNRQRLVELMEKTVDIIETGESGR